MRSPRAAALAFLLAASSLDAQTPAAAPATPAAAPTADQATVYAAPDGDDAASGTRAEPVRSLARAIDLATRTGRPVVRLAYGDYLVDAGLSLGPGMTAIGGLEPGTWVPAGPGRRSVLAPSVRFRAQGTLLSAAAGAVTLSGIELRDEAGMTATLLSLSGTALAARDVSFVLRGDGRRAALSASAAAVTIADSAFTATQADAVTLAAVAGGTMTLTGCTFHGPSQSEEFACIAASEGARIVVTGSSLDPGSGLKVRGIRAAGSSVTLENTRLSSGAGFLEAAAVDVRGGTLLARNCDFTAHPDAVAPTCLRADGSSATVEASRMEVAGQTGAAGIMASGGTLALRGSTLHGGTAAEYLYLIRAETADLSVEDCILAGGDTGDLVDILVHNGRLVVSATTIAAGRGRLSTTAISAIGSQRLEVTATVLAAPAGAVGPAILAMRSSRGLPAELAVDACCFGGWERLIGFDPVSGIRDVATVEALNGLDGDPFGGRLDGCFVEDPATTFRGEGDYRVSEASRCFAEGIGARTVDE